MNRVALRFGDDDDKRISAVLLGHQGRRRGILALVLLLASLTFIAATAWQLTVMQEELSAVRLRLQAQGPRPAAKTTVTARALAPEQRQAWNQLVRQLNTPWSEVLAALETSTPEDVVLVSIEPDARTASVRLQAEARTLGALLSYADALAAVGPFLDVTPVKHETHEQDPTRPIRLSLNLRLRGQAAAGGGGAP